MRHGGLKYHEISRHAAIMQQAAREAKEKFGEINDEAAKWQMQRIEELKAQAGLKKGVK